MCVWCLCVCVFACVFVSNAINVGQWGDGMVVACSLMRLAICEFRALGARGVAWGERCQRETLWPSRFRFAACPVRWWGACVPLLPTVRPVGPLQHTTHLVRPCICVDHRHRGSKPYLTVFLRWSREGTCPTGRKEGRKTNVRKETRFRNFDNLLRRGERYLPSSRPIARPSLNIKLEVATLITCSVEESGNYPPAGQLLAQASTFKKKTVPRCLQT